MGTLKQRSNGILYSNTVIGTLAVIMGGLLHLVQQEGHGQAAATLSVPSLLYQM